MGLSITRNGNPGETTAKINIDVSISLPTNTNTAKYSNKNYQYSFNQTNWYNLNQDNIIVRNLSSGKKTTIIIYCRITYDIDYYKWKNEYDNEGNVIGGSYVWSSSTTGASSPIKDSVNVYTHPGPWHWSDYISKNDIIEQTLTHSDINKWVEHLAAWKSWDTQEDWYSFYNDYYNNSTKDGYKVNKGDIIYMDWFNNCASAHPRASTISHSGNEDIISVDRFLTLDFNGAGDY